MPRRGADLAAQFRVAIEDAERARRRAEEAHARLLEQARKARGELLDDLEAFGQAVGVLGVQRHDDELTLRFHERYVCFDPVGEMERIRVRFDGADEEEHRLVQEPELSHRWVWVRRRRHREDRLPLFDSGLEELMVLALGLPRPGEEADVSRFPATEINEASKVTGGPQPGAETAEDVDEDDLSKASRRL